MSFSPPSHLPSTSTVVSKAADLRRAIVSSVTTTSPSSTIILGMSNKQTHRLQSCRTFIGQPLTRVEAQDKMKRNSMFRQATLEFDGSVSNHQTQGKTDLVAKAIQLEYGLRLRSCLLSSRPSSYSSSNNNNNKRAQLPY
jgi:hypothetical protein